MDFQQGNRRNFHYGYHHYGRLRLHTPSFIPRTVIQAEPSPRKLIKVTGKFQSQVEIPDSRYGNRLMDDPCILTTSISTCRVVKDFHHRITNPDQSLFVFRGSRRERRMVGSGKPISFVTSEIPATLGQSYQFALSLVLSDPGKGDLVFSQKGRFWCPVNGDYARRISEPVFRRFENVSRRTSTRRRQTC